MPMEVTREHEWLQRLAGEWTYEMEAEADPGQPPIRDSGTESVRVLGGVWAVCEGRGTSPEGGEVVSIMTIGYDPERRRFTGTFIGSMMTYLWLYEGQMDAAGKLTLDSQGPSYTDEGAMAKYRDTIEMVDDGHRVQTSSYQQADGSWHSFMTTHYYRAR